MRQASFVADLGVAFVDDWVFLTGRMVDSLVFCNVRSNK